MLTWQKRIHIFTCQLRYAMTRNVLSLFFVFSKILWHEFRVIISIPLKKRTKLLKKTIKKKCFSKRNTSGNTEFTFLNKLCNGEHYVTAGKAQQLLQASTNFLASLSKTFFFWLSNHGFYNWRPRNLFFHLTEQLTIRNPKPNYHGPIGIHYLMRFEPNWNEILQNSGKRIRIAKGL